MKITRTIALIALIGVIFVTALAPTPASALASASYRHHHHHHHWL